MKIGLLKHIVGYGLFLIFTLFPLNIKAERVRLFTPDDGLSNSHINNIFQDSKGYIWISTENGLNKFNGYDFEVYLSDPNDSASIQANYVTCVYEDSRGLFWVGTSNGLIQYDRTRNAFFQWKMGDDGLIINSRASCMFEDRNNNLWVAFAGNGVVRLDAETLSYTVFNVQNSGIGSNTIGCMFEDRHGNIWLGTGDRGVSVLNPQNNTIKHYYHIPGDTSSLNNNRVFSICENASGQIWVGTIGGGINVFDERTQSFQTLITEKVSMENLTYSMLLDKNQTVWVGTDGAGIFMYDVNGNKTPYSKYTSSYDLRKAKVHDLFQDKQGNIWAALYQKGVLFIPASGSYFQNIGFNPFDVSKSIGTLCVISIVEDYQGNVWAGTDGDGLYQIMPSGDVRHYTLENTPGFKGNVITALFEDREHNIWIGTYLNGFFRYNPKTGLFDSHFHRLLSGDGLNNNHIAVFNQDDEGNLWLGTNGGGINVFNPKTRKFKRYVNYSDNTRDQISGNWVFDIMIDRDKGFWVATSNGLNYLNKDKDIFEEYNLSNDNPGISNLMYTILEDEKGNIWIGSYYGLYHLNKCTGKSSLITTNEGLPDNMITGIEKDKDNALWISTGKGLCRYYPETGECLNFFSEDGIQSNEFRRRSHFKGKNDKMYFGGINGITTFYPDLVSEKPLLDLVFTDFWVNNEPVRLGKSNILTKPLYETTSIRLKYNQNTFTFFFAALEYGMPNRVDYFAKFENFDTQWRHVSSNNRSVRYTNLNSGVYVFKVKATIDGINILQKEIQVVILPPWWRSIPAIVVYVILVLLFLYGIYTYLSYRKLEQYQKQLELIVEQRTKELVIAKEKAEESDKLKSAFLANMSHEIRTPLNGIVGFLGFINSENLSPVRRQEYINIINNSSTQLSRIIDDIMDVSKIEANQMTITPVPMDLNDLMHDLHDFFETYLKAKFKDHVTLILDDSGFINQHIIYADALRLRQVLNNLINNAIKFTEKGFIRFGYRKSEQDMLEFVVEDSGIGLRNDQLEVIFDRFRQAEFGHTSRLYGGTGLGLTISRSLVQLGGGKMWVESAEGLGSSFYFTISYLPIAQEDVHVLDTVENTPNENKVFFGKSVLLIEPNVLKFNYYEKLILATGASVLKVESLQQWQNNVMQSDKIDLVIVDIELFDNEDDFYFIRRVKKEFDNMPVVLIISIKNEKFIHFHNFFNTTVQPPVRYADILKIMEMTTNSI